MRSGDAVPRVAPDQPLTAALLEISRKGMGMTTVVDAAGQCVGIFTDGDLRRLIERGHDLANLKIGDVMHKNPRSINPDQMAVEAARIMEEHRINQLTVTEADGTLIGALHIHDLTNAKVI
jgi:arabinose-5-phosphate isomerase